MTEGALLEALMTGGPTAVLVVVVGWFMRGWAGRVDRSLAKCQGELVKLGKKVAALEAKVGQ